MYNYIKIMLDDENLNIMQHDSYEKNLYSFFVNKKQAENNIKYADFICNHCKKAFTRDYFINHLNYVCENCGSTDFIDVSNQNKPFLCDRCYKINFYNIVKNKDCQCSYCGCYELYDISNIYNMMKNTVELFKNFDNIKIRDIKYLKDGVKIVFKIKDYLIKSTITGDMSNDDIVLIFLDNKTNDIKVGVYKKIITDNGPDIQENKNVKIKTKILKNKKKL